MVLGNFFPPQINQQPKLPALLFTGSSPTSSLPWPGAALLGFLGCSHSNTHS